MNKLAFFCWLVPKLNPTGRPLLLNLRAHALYVKYDVTVVAPITATLTVVEFIMEKVANLLSSKIERLTGSSATNTTNGTSLHQAPNANVSLKTSHI